MQQQLVFFSKNRQLRVEQSRGNSSGVAQAKPEFLTRGYFIYRFYDVALGRLPTYEEFLADFQRLSGPQTLAQQEANKVAFVNEFVGRAEFRSLYGDFNNAQNFDALLRRASGQLRPPNTVVLPNRDALVAALVAGRRTPAQTLRDVIESPQVSARFVNRGFVTMQYFGYLQRNPDADGFNAWLNVLDGTGDFRTMINGFVNSVEYQLRFGPVQ